MSHYLWIFLLSVYAVSVAAESRLHANNIRHLVHHGAVVRSSWVLGWFYRSQVIIVLLAVTEHLQSTVDLHNPSLAGLWLFALGFVARQWGISRQGRLWTRSFVVIDRKLVAKNIPGPRWVQSIETLGRFVEIVSFCLILQAFFVLTVALLILPLEFVAVLKAETRLMNRRMQDL